MLPSHSHPPLSSQLFFQRGKGGELVGVNIPIPLFFCVPWHTQEMLNALRRLLRWELCTGSNRVVTPLWRNVMAFFWSFLVSVVPRAKQWIRWRPLADAAGNKGPEKAVLWLPFLSPSSARGSKAASVMLLQRSCCNLSNSFDPLFVRSVPRGIFAGLFFPHQVTYKLCCVLQAFLWVTVQHPQAAEYLFKRIVPVALDYFTAFICPFFSFKQHILICALKPVRRELFYQPPVAVCACVFMCVMHINNHSLEKYCWLQAKPRFLLMALLKFISCRL